MLIGEMRLIMHDIRHEYSSECFTLYYKALGEAKKYPTSVVVVGGTQWLPT